jgi:hypothetical protein
MEPATDGVSLHANADQVVGLEHFDGFCTGNHEKLYSNRQSLTVRGSALGPSGLRFPFTGCLSESPG